MRKGFWGDVGALGKNRDGKFFFAVPKLIKEDVATKFYIPKRKMRSYEWFNRVELDKEFKAHPATLAIVSVDRLFCHPMIDSWRIPFEKEFPQIKIYDVR